MGHRRVSFVTTVVIIKIAEKITTNGKLLFSTSQDRLFAHIGKQRLDNA